MRKIRVLHTLCRVNSGGVEQRRLILVQGLPTDRYEHAIVCQDAAGALPGLFAEAGCTVHQIGLAPSILSPRWHDKAYQFAKFWKPDLVHGAVFEGVALACGVGLRMPRVPVISEETSDPINRSWRGNLLMRGMCLRSKIVIGVSPAVGSYLRCVARVPARKIHVVNNGVSPATVMASAEVRRRRAEFGIGPDELVIGSVGRMVDTDKRFSDVIHAMVLLRERFSCKLLIIGDGPDLSMLQNLARDLAIGDHVIFAGYQGDTRSLYPLMDVFALASMSEAFGLVLVEAMLAGVPVVATRVGGIPFVLDGGAAGLLVPPGAPECIAAEVARLLEDENFRVGLGARGRQRAEQEFHAARYCNDIDALYRGLVS